jgi:hypothetical protein
MRAELIHFAAYQRQNARIHPAVFPTTGCGMGLTNYLFLVRLAMSGMAKHRLISYQNEDFTIFIQRQHKQGSKKRAALQQPLFYR